MANSADQANDRVTDRDPCPRCGGTGAVFGTFLPTFSEYHGAVGFYPRSVAGGFASGVGIDAAFRACLKCGLTWSSLSPTKLRHHMQRFGGELARQELDEIDRGIYRDLPDTDLAREIAEKVAEIDYMVRRGEFGAVARYRELRGVPWDQAIKQMQGWSRLTRAEKLELFGWVSKKKPPVDDWF
jgi:hypothetical protein